MNDLNIAVGQLYKCHKHDNNAPCQFCPCIVTKVAPRFITSGELRVKCQTLKSYFAGVRSDRFSRVIEEWSIEELNSLYERIS